MDLPRTIPVGDEPWRVVAGQLNDDPFADLVVSHWSTAGTWILLADGLGGFAAPTVFETSAYSAPALVDLDLNGTLDLALGLRFIGLRTYLGDGNGGFGPATGLWGIGNYTQRVRPGFLDADAWPDLLVVAESSNTYGLLGTGSGTFSAPLNYGNYGGVYDGVIADLNGDAHADWVLSRGFDLVFLFGDGTGSFTGYSQSFGFGAQGLAAADWNADGFTDLAVSTGGGVQRILLGDGTGIFADGPAADRSPVLCHSWTLAAPDLDLDGDADLLCPDVSYSRLTVSLGTGTGALTAGRTFLAGFQPRTVAIAPFDALPGPDLLVGNYATGSGFRLLSNLGGGLFGPPAAFTPAGAEWLLGVAADDLDGDGDQDAVFAALTSPARVGVALGDGAGEFPDWSLLDPAMSPWAVATGRFDFDSWPDLAVHGRQGVNGVALLAGDGAGGFGAPIFYAGAGTNSTIGFAVADLDGDGDLDVAHPNAEAASFTVRLGDGAGGLGTATTYPVTGTCNDVDAADLDGDLDLDLVAIGLRLTVLLQGGEARRASRSTRRSSPTSCSTRPRSPTSTETATSTSPWSETRTGSSPTPTTAAAPSPARSVSARGGRPTTSAPKISTATACPTSSPPSTTRIG